MSDSIYRLSTSTIAAMFMIITAAVGFAHSAEPVDHSHLIESLKSRPTIDTLSRVGELLGETDKQQAAFDAILSAAPIVAEKNPAHTAEVLRGFSKWLESTSNRKQLAELETTFRKRAALDEKHAGFVPLFDGKSLSGWHGDLSMFRVADEQIVGGNLRERVDRNYFLCSDQTHGDFELRIQFQLQGNDPNSGVQFRSRYDPKHGVIGYQADLGPEIWGTLYDESRRNRVLAGPPIAERDHPICANDWNDYRIHCESKRIRLWINGILTVDYEELDDEMPRDGIVALQVHSGAPMQVRFKNIRIRQISRP